MNAHRGVTLLAYKYDVLIFNVPHDIDGPFSFVHEFLTRSYAGHSFFCHGNTVSEMNRLANRVFKGIVQSGPKKSLDKRRYVCYI